MQRNVINRLVSKFTFDKMIRDETQNGSKAFTALQMLDIMKRNIWAELPGNGTIDTYRRNLQKIYIDALVAIIQGDPSQGNRFTTSDAAGIARVQVLHNFVQKLTCPNQRFRNNQSSSCRSGSTN